MRAERRLRRLLALPLLACGLGMSAAPALAGPNGGVGYRVDGEPGSIIDRGFITLQASPGGTASGHFFATNSGDTDAQLSVYAADGLTGDTTGIVYSGLGDAKRDAGNWLAPSTRGIYLRADDARRVDFSLKVPSGATPGDHVGGIVLEQRRTGGAISQVVRNVVPVLVDVSGPAGTSIDLRSALITDLPGTTLPAVTVKMVNTGRRICRPVLSVAMTGPSERGATVTRELDAILPGDAVPFPLPWPRPLDTGSYVALVTLTGCGPTRTMRTDVRSDVTAESGAGGGGNEPSGDDVITKAAPGPTKFTAPRTSDTRDRGGRDADRRSGGRGRDEVSGIATGSGVPPVGTAGSAKAGGRAGGGDGLKLPLIGDLGKLGRVAVRYLPSLLERLIAPLSLLGLMLLFLFAQEAFDRKDPKLAMAPVSRDPDLEFLPLDRTDLLPASPESDLELVPAPPPRPSTT